MADIFGLEVADLPDGWQPINVIVIVECVDFSDPDESGAGLKRLSTRANDENPLWNAMGMLAASSADLAHQYVGKLEDP